MEDTISEVIDLCAKPPLVVHIIYRLAIGGLENGLVNLINNMPAERYRHAIVCLKDVTDFSNRIQRADVPVIAMHKREGQDFGMYVRLWKIFQRLRPDIVHTRNIGTVEYLIPAALAKIPVHIHAEHGFDICELEGSNLKYNLLRKAIRPLVHHYIAVSGDLRRWLVSSIGARSDRVTQIYNGVDTDIFHPCKDVRPSFGPEDFAYRETRVIGTVGRMEAVKDQMTLVRAFLRLLDSEPDGRDRLRLVMIGDGSVRIEARKLLEEARAEHLAWLPGERDDIRGVMRSFDVFVLPSLREGISNTILEAMATGLPVVATRVGGNPELVEDGGTGILVPPGNPEAMAEAVRSYISNPGMLTSHGQAGRKRAETQFSMDKMVRSYLDVYDTVLRKRTSV